MQEGYRKQNVNLPIKLWSSIIIIAGEMTAQQGKRIPFYSALEHIVKLGLERYHEQAVSREAAITY